MLGIFGLLLSGLGLGYAVHKDNQKFANMRANATRLYGRGITESFSDDHGDALMNKYFWELKKYFDERYDYYINNRDYIMNHTDIKDVKRPDISPENLQQHYAGSLAYHDMFCKYAPDYVKWMSDPLPPSDWYDNKIYSCIAFSDIARALARKDVYRQGFLPAHMHNMNCRLEGKALYCMNGCSVDLCGLGPSAYDSVNWERERFKYHYYSFGDQMPSCKRK